MLGYFRIKRACLVYQWHEIVDDYYHVARRYYPKASKKKKNLNRQTRSELYKKVFAIEGFNRCDKAAEETLSSHLIGRAKHYIDHRELFYDALTWLKSREIAVPGYSTLQKIISTAVNNEETRLAYLIKKHLLDEDGFLQLLNRDKGQYGLNALKKLAKSNKPDENKAELSRHEALSGLSKRANVLIRKLKLNAGNIRYFAKRCRDYNIRDLRELKAEKSLIYLICFVVTRFQQSNDSLTVSLFVAFNGVEDQAKEYRDVRVVSQALALAETIEKVPQLINLFVDKSFGNELDLGTFREKAFRIISETDIPLVSQSMADAKPDKAHFKWEYFDSNFSQVISKIRPLFRALEIKCRGNETLSQQIASTKLALQTNKMVPPMNGRIMKHRDKKYITVGDKQCTANRSEWALYKAIYDGIRKGDIFIENSLEYRSFDDYVVNNSIWRQRHKHLADLGLDWMTKSQHEHLDQLKALLQDKINSVSNRISDGANSYIRRKPDEDKLLWTRAVEAKDSVLTEKFFSKFDQKTIVNVLRHVDAETGFLDKLRPQSARYKKSAIEMECLLACLIANGTFQGTFKFASVSGQQYQELKRVEDDCFHHGALQQAISAITSNATRLAIFDDFRLSDGEIHSSADGQRFGSKHGNPLVGHAPKHFGLKKSGIVYTLVASHFATNGKVISARSHESHHLFDVVYNSNSELKATVVSTDTHGSNQFNYAILNAFGYQFTPRYAKFKHRFLTEFDVKYDNGVELSLTKDINWKLIESEWDNLTKIFLSLGMRTVQQSTLVKKLCSYPKKNATMLALTEYNRVFKCLHLLDYADGKQLRQVIQESLNRGEQFQGLKRALASLGGNRFRGKDPEEMEMWNACADVLANCIVYYNAKIMSSFKTHCIDSGNEKQLVFLRSISPASWEHIGLNGFYDLAENDDEWDLDAAVRGVSLAA
jgi:TnpA family transposase